MAISGPTTLSVRAAAAVAATALLLSGCGAEDEGEAAQGTSQASPSPTSQSPVPQGDGPRLVQGGEPGAEAEDVPADTTVPPNEASHADVSFMQMMIPHHGQALTMSRMAPERAADPRVLTMAERIEAGQGPEIVVMASWLEEAGVEVPRADDDHEDFDHGAHGHTEMAGMLSDEQLQQLEDARGAAFDRLFLGYMIQHHEGAVAMAADTAADGTDVLVAEMRDGLSSSQGVEIDRMQQILDTL